MLLQYIPLISIITSSFGGFFYIRDTLKGQTKSNRITWFIWALAPMIIVGIQLEQGFQFSTVPVFMAGFIPLLVFIASFKNKNSYWKLTIFDYFCGICALISLLFWIFYKNTYLATTFAILTDGIAFLPTFIKSWIAPHTETLTPYIMGAINQILGLSVLSLWIFPLYGFSLYLLIGNSTLIIFIILRRRVLF